MDGGAERREGHAALQCLACGQVCIRNVSRRSAEVRACCLNNEPALFPRQALRHGTDCFICPINQVDRQQVMKHTD